MQHTIDELLRKIQAMQDIAMLAHREKYKQAPGAEYDVAHVTHLVEQVQAMAGDIFNDKTKHPKLKAKMENR
tara:strand:+ start:1278 stop:1493 length:216 start_codon:yes stop_codon:yes gene_type:complete